jgi:capsular exopolysaccharide synthesis family protein
MGLFRKKAPPKPLTPAEPDEGLDRPINAEELVVRTQPASPLAEQFRRLWSAIEALNPDGAPRTVMITSALPGDGKTVAALNLAMAFCERPHARIVLVDADLRRPALEDYLGLPRRQGFAELLEGRLGLDRAIRKTSEPALDIIGAGQAPPNPTKIIRVDRLKALFHGLKQRYDYVIIDAPPAHLLTEPHLIGAAADGILLAVRMGKTPKGLVEETSQQLESMGGNLLGVCLLGANERPNIYA